MTNSADQNRRHEPETRKYARPVAASATAAAAAIATAEAIRVERIRKQFYRYGDSSGGGRSATADAQQPAGEFRLALAVRILFWPNVIFRMVMKKSIIALKVYGCI